MSIKLATTELKQSDNFVYLGDVINLGAHSAKVELCARASIRLACFAGTCQILVHFRITIFCRVRA